MSQAYFMCHIISGNRPKKESSRQFRGDVNEGEISKAGKLAEGKGKDTYNFVSSQLV